MNHGVNVVLRIFIACALGVLAGVAESRAAGDAATPGKPEQVKRIAAMPPEQVRARLMQQFAADANAGPAAASVVAALGSEPLSAEFDILDQIATAAALTDDRVAQLVRICSGPTEPWFVDSPSWLHDRTFGPWLRDQLRLYFGRWLARRKMYDQAVAVLAGLEPADVVDPASLLFYQAAAYHHQLRKEPGLRAIDQLLNDVRDVPRRFQVVAGLMREDLKKLEDDSLDHIARRMDDIRRRLDEGNADKRTRRIEDGVIASLDKMIEDLEKQRQQQQSSGGGGGQSGTPMQDSRIAKQKGPGQTDPKDIGHKSEWGDLPPETREQIRQQLGRDLPAHYYDLIQQYFNAPQGAAGPAARRP